MFGGTEPAFFRGVRKCFQHPLSRLLSQVNVPQVAGTAPCADKACSTLEGVQPEAVRDLFATALEIEPRQHLLIQAAFQSSVDNAVSKTINLPAEAAPDAVAEVYREAYRLGLKGITIYRYGSIAQQVLQLGVGEEPYEKEHASKCDPYQCKL